MSGPEAVLLQIFVPYNPDGIRHPWRGLITDRYTFARYENEPWLLFDNQNDPWQMTNLAGKREHAALVTRLDGQLAALMSKHGDAWRFNSSELVEEGGRLYRHETFYTIEDYLRWAKANPSSSPKEAN